MQCMKARIRNSDFSWGIDEPVTPKLIETILKNGKEAGIIWKDTEFYKICKSLLLDRKKEELIEKLYDESQEIIAEIIVLFQLQQMLNTKLIATSFRKDEDSVLFIRLYLPVFLLILENYIED